MRGKWFSVVTMLVAFFCLLSGCKQEEPYYRTYKENGEWYLQITREVPDTGYFGSCRDLSEDFAIPFGSALEMARTLKSGALSLEWLDYLIKATGGKKTFQIADLDALYEPVCPDDLTVDKDLYMNHSLCVFDVEGEENNIYGEFEIRYGIHYRIPYYPIIPEGETVKYEIELTEQNANRKASEVLLEEQGVGAEERSPELLYRLISGEDTYIVREKLNEEIEIFAERDGVSLYVKLRGLRKFPALEWITQFDLKPLEGTY